MGHLNMRRKGIQSTKEKTTNIDLEDKRKKSVLRNFGPYQNERKKNYSDI